MNEYGDQASGSDPNEQPPAAPTWQWTGTAPSARPNPAQSDAAGQGAEHPDAWQAGPAQGYAQHDEATQPDLFGTPYIWGPPTGQLPPSAQYHAGSAYGTSYPPPYAGPAFGGPTGQPLPGQPPYGQPPYGPQLTGQPVPGQSRPGGLTRRTKVIGGVAAALLVATAAVGGAAIGYAQGSNSSTGVASGGLGSQAPSQSDPLQGGPGQSPFSGGQQNGNGNGNGSGNGFGNGHRNGNGGKAQSYTPPGKATSDQRIGVVDIYTTLKYQSAKAAGTGMVLTSDGEILTNNHVVEGSTTIRVTVVSTGRTYPATVVGTDKVDDVAVLQLQGASGLTPVSIDSDGVQVGDPVTAVGNAMGLGGLPSAAKGKIIGLNRAITTQSEGGVEGERLVGMIEVDAQVISGDSGGPLYDAQNEVIGMDTAASSSPVESRGFAIPIAKALAIAEKMQNGEEGGNIYLGVPGFLGIEFQPGSGYGGAAVTAVVPKTPAAQLGLAPGDVITSVSGTAITSGTQLRTVLSGYKGGDSVLVTWSDASGQSHTNSATLIDGPAL